MRPLRSWIVAIVFFAQILFGLTVQVATAPQASAACATGFPTVGWQAIRTTTGAELTDPKNDFTPYPSGGTGDISSATGSPMDWFSSGDGCDFFFRLRLVGDPRKGTGLDNNFYVVAIGRGTTPLVWVGINGEGNNNASYVYAYNPSTGTYLSNLAVNSNNGSDKIKVEAVTVGVTTEYYLQWRIANSILPSSVFTSPVGLFAGTSQSNNVETINADCIDSLLTGSSCTPKYTGTLGVDLTKNTDSAIRPNITSVTPSKGTTAGGTSVSIAGTNLANTSQVYFGGKAATITSSTNTTINVSVSTPASGTTGPVDVFIVNPGGTSNTLADAYTYITAPVVATIAASGVASTSAQLNADINPGADLLTAASFCYGTASNLTGCTSVDVTESLASIGSGTTNVRVTKQLTGLTTNTLYYFKISATNSLGTTTGSILSFTPANATLSISTSSLPSGTYGVAYSTPLAATGGTGTYSSWALTAGTLPSGLSLNTTTGVISGTPAATASATSLTFTVTDSQPTTSVGKVLALTIAVGLPIATTNDPTSIGATTATLNGSVTANGASTAIAFCLATSGVTNSSGALTCSSTPTATNTPTSTSASSSSALTGLTSGNIYYYQIYATNSAGTDYGAVKNFIPASAPSLTTSAASSISSSSATLNGSVTANGSSAAISFCLATSSAQTGSALTTCISNPTSSPSATLSSSTVTATTGSLTNGTTYYFQAYATNTTGTTYGSVLNFTVTATTTTTVTAAPTATTLGKVVNLATTVSPNTATGTVVFKDALDATLCTVASLTTGAGNCDWTPGSAASYVVTAHYTSSNLSAFTSSTSSTTTVTVNAGITVSAGSDPSTIYGTSTTSSAFTTSGGTGAKTWTVVLASDSSTVSGITISSGVITVAATTAAGTYSMTVKATDTVSSVGTKAATVTVSAAALTITSTTTSATKVYETSNPTFSFSSSGLKNGESISSVTNTFTGTSYNSTSVPSDVGSYTVTPSAAVFGSGSASNYTITYATVAYSITKASQSVLWSPTTTYQTSAQPVTWSSVATGYGSITYAVTTVGDINCAIVSEKLTWTISATGSCVVTASAAGDGNHNAGSIAKTFTITALTIQTITFNTPGNQTYGTTFTVSATASPSGLPVAISTSGGCTGSGTSTSGSTVTLTASAGGSGNCSITASQSGDGTYAPASDVTRAIDIAKASRAITLTAGSSTIAYLSLIHI
jgi:hypothetical protein